MLGPVRSHRSTPRSAARRRPEQRRRRSNARRHCRDPAPPAPDTTRERRFSPSDARRANRARRVSWYQAAEDNADQDGPHARRHALPLGVAGLHFNKVHPLSTQGTLAVQRTPEGARCESDASLYLCVRRRHPARRRHVCGLPRPGYDGRHRPHAREPHHLCQFLRRSRDRDDGHPTQPHRTHRQRLLLRCADVSRAVVIRGVFSFPSPARRRHHAVHLVR
mmetsp:Transcript_552/g.1781  ORF Transcript_552/g.1781 Transcript_552/m.1781 type:complete len:221 (+) Transcript_552:1489-2151(+)